jgi:hypothetical protein
MPVEIEGIVEIQKALRKFAPELMKGMQKEVRPLLASVTNSAKAKLPPEMSYDLRNFNYPGYERKSGTSKARAFPSYNVSEVRKGLTYSLAASRKNRSGYVSLARLLNKSAAGAIIETAGRKGLYGSERSMSDNPDAGAHFIRQLSNFQVGPLKQYGKGEKTKGRLLFAAWYEQQNRVMPLVVKAYEKAAMEFKRRLDLAA